MTATIKPFCEHFSAKTLTSAAQQLLVSLQANRGARIGETTVISRQVHMYDLKNPETVQIMLNSDAGQTFYHRKDTGKIVHIDVFHQCGVIRPAMVAASIRSILTQFHSRCGSDLDDLYLNPDWIDIQTGGGGGRITGRLCYGRKASLLKAHENHVHVTLMAPSKQLTGLFYVVYAVEKAILASRLALRRNEAIVYVENCNAVMDASPFTSQSDSLLKGDGESLLAEKKTGTGEQEQEEEKPEEDSFFDKPQRDGSSSAPATEPQALSGNGYTRDSEGQVLVGADEPGIIQKVLQLLSPHKRRPLEGNVQQQTIMKIEKCLRTFPRKEQRTVKNGMQDTALPFNTQSKRSKRISEKLGTAPLSELDISETIHAAASRKALENHSFLSIRKEDLRHFVRHKQKGPDVCFILDASASMEGKRLQAAKNFARQLFSRMRGRIGIISFQDNKAQINVPLTQSSVCLEKGLLDIAAFGRTPLALGLTASIDYLQQARASNAVIVLVTDGLADNTNSTMQQSLTDALQAAGQIKKHGYRFIGIGLKPHQDYLVQLSREAGGITYAFDEFNNEVLKCEIVLKN